MQSIANEIIGTTLQQIWRGNLRSAPPIHIWTAKHSEGYMFLGLNKFTEHVDPGKTLPSAVMVLAFDNRRGGGPYLLYWVEDSERPDLRAKITEWSAKISRLEAEEIISMGIGNTI